MDRHATNNCTKRPDEVVGGNAKAKANAPNLGHGDGNSTSVRLVPDFPGSGEEGVVTEGQEEDKDDDGDEDAYEEEDGDKAMGVATSTRKLPLTPPSLCNHLDVDVDAAAAAAADQSKGATGEKNDEECVT
jgi:hypothetical protein